MSKMGILFVSCLLIIGGFIIWRLFQEIRFYKLQEKELDEYAREVETVYRQMSGIRHDYRNHLHVMKAYLSEREYHSLETYLEELTYEMNQVDSIIRTGNTLIDALVNAKLTRAKQANVQIDASAIAPKEVGIPSTDLAVILGNLLNNAVEATSIMQESTNQSFIRVYIAPMKNNLYISVQNSMQHQPNKNFLSLKSPNRIGYGIRRIDQAVANNDGIVNRQWEEGVFATEVTLPMK
ncbi:TPA: sensor histidine kinase [Streptococcus suis]